MSHAGGPCIIVLAGRVRSALVGLTGFVDREPERHRAIQLVQAVAGVREIMVRYLVVHREPSALSRDLSKIGGCVLAVIFKLVQHQKERGESSTHPPEIDKCPDEVGSFR
jgi:hypothetical protein